MKTTERACTIISGISAMLFLGSCCTKPDATPISHAEYQSDVATVMVTPEPLVPWYKIKAGLQPGFTTGGETMLSKVAPDTLTSEQKSYDELNATLAAGLPTTVSSHVLTNTNTNGTLSTTNTDTTTKGSGSPPNSTPALPSKGASGLPPAASILSGARSLDPMMQYTAATALNEEVALLNQYLAELEADTADQYVAYVLRLHITVAPKLRNLPYDGYIDVSLLPGETQITAVKAVETETNQPQKPPKLLPLLASESLESVLQSNSAENVREFALALQGTIDAIGLNANTQAIHDKLATIIGRDLNSTLLVGRISDDTIRIRIGAMAQSITGNTSESYALVPVSHNITTLVLVPRELDMSKGLVVATRTLFRDARTGETLPDDPTLRLRHRYDIGLILSARLAPSIYPEFIHYEDHHANFLALANKVWEGNWKGFSKTMSCLLKNLDKPEDVSDKTDLAWYVLNKELATVRKKNEFNSKPNGEQKIIQEGQLPYSEKSTFTSSPSYERKITMILDLDRTNISEEDFEELLQRYSAGNFQGFKKQLERLAKKYPFLMQRWNYEGDNLSYLIWARVGDYVASSRISTSRIDFGYNEPKAISPVEGIAATLPPNDQTAVFKADPDDAATLTTTLVGGKRLDTLADLGATLQYLPSADGKTETSYAKSIILSSDGTQVTLTFQIDGARTAGNSMFLQDPKTVLSLHYQTTHGKVANEKYTNLAVAPEDKSANGTGPPVVLSTTTKQIARLPDGTAELFLTAKVTPPKAGSQVITYALSITGADITSATLNNTNLALTEPLSFSTSGTFDLHLKNTSSAEKIVCTANDSSKTPVSSVSIAVVSK